ncbi:hypothetical protein HELRODRAFT_90119, partial [Helobdella robusta]|uniref:Brix domain-containing protein n=1 Tax=Helobdella robusta TaxID=6412 RepID=T1G7L3_HELRO
QFKRQRREMREFIYRRSIEDRDNTLLEKKKLVKESVDESKPIPTNLRKEAIDVFKSLDWEDEGGEGVTTQEDNEYKWAGVADPKIIVTTSRDPGSRLKQFAKEIRLMFPNSKRINRGNHDMKTLMAALRANDYSDLIILSETRGSPDQMIVCHLPYGPTAYFNLSNVVMRHDIPDVGKMSEEYPLLMFDSITSNLGERVKDILRYLFPVAKDDSKRIISFTSLDGTYISFRHHISKKVDKKFSISEIGPRFEMKLYKIIRGTVDVEDSCDVEYQLSTYMRTAKFKVPLWKK